MKKLTSMADLEGVRRSLQEQRLEAERQELLKAEAEKRRAEEEKRRQDEASLFRKQLRGVTPLADSNIKVHTPQKPAPIIRQRVIDDGEMMLMQGISDEMDVDRFLETDDKLSYRRNGVGMEALKKLRRGQLGIKAQIDLHGYTSDEARLAVVEFLRSCVKQDIRCVRIIHGKGLSSAGREPVLKEKVKRWLVQKEEVLAFCQAPPRDGGEGALLVILKARQ